MESSISIWSNARIQTVKTLFACWKQPTIDLPSETVIVQIRLLNSNGKYRLCKLKMAFYHMKNRAQFQATWHRDGCFMCIAHSKSNFTFRLYIFFFSSLRLLVDCSSIFVHFYLCLYLFSSMKRDYTENANPPRNRRDVNIKRSEHTQIMNSNNGNRTVITLLLCEFQPLARV